MTRSNRKVDALNERDNYKCKEIREIETETETEIDRQKKRDMQKERQAERRQNWGSI